MRASWGKQVLIRACIIAGSIWVTGCSYVSDTPSISIACGQCEETDRFVRLQAVTGDGRAGSLQPFTHPFTLSPEDWKSILTALQVQRQAEGLFLPGPQGSVVPAFTEEESTYLSESLSKAFAQAQPDEWVMFGSTRATSQGLNELTTGGGYVEGTLLHVVLANYRKAVTMASTRQLLWKRPLRADAGLSYVLVAGKHQAIVRDPSSVSSLLSSAPSELTIAYQALLLREPVGAPGSQETSEGNQSSIPSPKNVPPPCPSKIDPRR